VPKSHGSSVLHEAIETKTLDDVLKMVSEFSKALPATNDEVLLAFEHGSKLEDKSRQLCSTQHAHLHLIYLTQTDFSSLVERIEGIASERSLDALLNEVGAFDEYLAVLEFDAKGQNFGGGYACDASGVPSQYMRKLVGEIVGLRTWNWKIEGRPELLQQMIGTPYQMNVPI
jgi:hypothetical protein